MSINYLTVLYGIPNCDTVKKARKWLDTNEINYEFHDFRKDGLHKDKAKQWLAVHGWESVVNRRSTSWKELNPSIREKLDTEAALEAILTNPTLIKRPVLEPSLSDTQKTQKGSVIGFSESSFCEIFKK